MQRTSKGDCKAPEIVQGEAIHDWRTIPVGSCLGGGLWLIVVDDFGCWRWSAEGCLVGALPGREMGRRRYGWRRDEGRGVRL